MKRIFYYTTTALVLSCGITQAQTCVPTPTCSSLGYTSSTACDGGLKCPFGNYWYCPSNSGGECADFPYTCFGRGYVEGAGIGADCNGKYVKCECYEGFEWKDGKGCIESSTECKIGAILYNDMTCSSSIYDHDIGVKTAIGIVFYTDGMGHGQAMALQSLGSHKWGEYGIDIPTLTNYDTDESASKDYDSCENTAKIIAAGDKSKNPAAWAAHEYKTAGTKAGDWCLPAAGIFTSYYNNKDAIVSGFTKAGGVQFSYLTWSSTEKTENTAWRGGGGNGVGGDFKDYGREVRPVIEFPVEEHTAPACDSSYKYTCTNGSYVIGGSGTACDGKFQNCTCLSPYEWSNGNCVCAAKYTCSGEHEIGGEGSSCNGKYTSCQCESGYSWKASGPNCSYGCFDSYAAQC